MTASQPTSDSLYETTVLLPAKALPFFETAVDSVASASLTCLIEHGEHKGMWSLQLIFEHQPDTTVLAQTLTVAATQAHIDLPAYTLTPMPSKNWLKESYQSFQPVVIGRYYIYGSHITTPPPAGKVALQIDAATAFGTGEHQTTHGCLEALDALDIKPKRVLDVGCGSGILAMAYAKTTGQPADAVDLDPESVRVTHDNAALNRLSRLITVWESNGYQAVSGLYDLIFCNILARPLMDMAGDLKNHLAPNGRAILSGFLTRQERWVLKSHTDLGFCVVARYRVKGWSTLVLTHSDV